MIESWAVERVEIVKFLLLNGGLQNLFKLRRGRSSMPTVKRPNTSLLWCWTAVGATDHARGRSLYGHSVSGYSLHLQDNERLEIDQLVHIHPKRAGTGVAGTGVAGTRVAGTVVAGAGVFDDRRLDQDARTTACTVADTVCLEVTIQSPTWMGDGRHGNSSF